jgi:hypothetical protein
LNNFTLIFSFYCNSAARRKYLNFCIQSIQRSNKNNNFKVLVVDGSDPCNHGLNKNLFHNFQNLTMIHDEEKNPISRLHNHMKKIDTKYCLKILEDCLFIDYDFSKIITNDISLLETKSENTVIQYPTLIDENINIINNILVYKKKIQMPFKFFKGAIMYYPRLLDRLHHNYLCNNILYNTNFLKKHLLHYSKICSGHAAAESDRFDKLFGIKYNSELKIAKIIKLINKTLFKSRLILETLITENYEKGVVLHIGYESTELDYFDNPDRVVVKENKGCESSTLANLEKISSLLKNETLIICEMGSDKKISFNNNVN